MYRKKLLILLLTLVLFMAPCLVFSNGQPDSKSPEKITLRVLAGQSTTDAGMEKLIDELCEQTYPNIKLEWDIVDWGKGFQPKMQLYMATELPDIMIGKAQDVATWGSQNVLADLSGKSYLEYVLPEAVESGSYGGKVNGVVFNALYQGVYYNKDLFKKYNVKVPQTQNELLAAVEIFKANGIIPFETHFADTWSIGNMTMQFAINDLFRDTPDWGDQFRAGKVNYVDSEKWKSIYQYNKLLFDNTWTDEAFSIQQNMADARMVQGMAAMKVSGSWSIQNFLDVDPDFNFGVFPFPNQFGEAKLIYEPNITFMVSGKTKYAEAVDQVLELILSNKELALKIYDQTKTAPMLAGITPTFTNPSQSDIDKYVAEGNIVDAGVGNNQLVWGGFQDENALDIVEWLYDPNKSLSDALTAADSRRENSRP
ncbi:ABC transporter substrate-binding protein [Oceanispirochaeta sp.]|jgi:ABC-type glycerol-3-phosphate transport system substrate-binding protein|uniref:ABC transporter substrate-binding protein n=1 Tax=Oceanispirochaeta sp. TaxID=2035350 RepID=UPI0026298D73|nr:extracellular solute-binding protein [Oceanispirochaeta sp.]MDA3957579.1 extracellular solute-binding protein [Oceanispirochaeta sp.]